MKLKQFIRKKDRTPVACLVAIRDGDTIRIGWSKCMARKDGKRADTFKRSDAEGIATDRALYNLADDKAIVPYIICKNIQAFVNRATRYFKGATKIVCGNVFDGTVSDFCLYNVALDNTQVEMMYNSGNGTTSDPISGGHLIQ